MQALKETFTSDEDRDFCIENDKIDARKEQLIKKCQQRVADRVFQDQLMEELRKVLDSYEIT